MDSIEKITIIVNESESFIEKLRVQMDLSERDMVFVAQSISSSLTMKAYKRQIYNSLAKEEIMKGSVESGCGGENEHRTEQTC